MYLSPKLLTLKYMLIITPSLCNGNTLATIKTSNPSSILGDGMEN